MSDTTTPQTLKRTVWTDVTVPGRTAVRARLHTPCGAAASGGWLVWAHGGSWQRGSATDWHPVTHRLAALSGWQVLSIDYRLAPAYRHPAALEDTLTALGWARTRADAEGVPVAIGGDSAGGTLAAVAALAVRDQDRRLPVRARPRPVAAQLLAYPPLDPACAAPSHHRDPRAFPQPAELRRAWRVWQGDGRIARSPDGTPLYSTPIDAADLRGLPPTVLAVGGRDPVADDVLGYVTRLRDAAVSVELIHPPGVAHGDLLQPGSRLLPRLAASLRALTTYRA
ncbi:alpha/beta hydrolase fold domain-containing protein [Streptomyces flaveolus]|uniref:alpha/beta hydrolase n=1 Tax=Streptomyces flaveolus TaxID=67297 RepID=UPI003328D6EF